MKPASGKSVAVVLRAPLADPSRLDQFVEDCLRDGIRLIAIAGAGAADIEDTIDDIIVGDGFETDRFIATTSHEDQSIEEVMEFAASWDGGSSVREERF